MARINLLDWRQARRDRRQKQFLTALGISFALGAGIIFGIVTQVDGQIQFQQQRNARLQTEIAAIDKQIKEIRKLEKLKTDLLARMKVIEQLQQSRTATVHFFDELVTTTPDGIYLTSLDQNGRKTKINGYSESNGRISTHIRNLEGSDWFRDPKLVVIKSDKRSAQRQSSYSLEVTTGAKKKGSGDEELVE